MNWIPGKTVRAKPRSLPKEYGASFTPEAAPSAATRAGAKTGLEIEDYSAYKLILLNGDSLSASGPTDQVRDFPVVETYGDHLYVAELAGIDGLYCKLGPRTNPWIRLRRGAVYTRVYWALHFRFTISGGSNEGALGPRAILYSSVGPLVQSLQPQSYGARHPMFFVFVATSVSTPIFTTAVQHHVTLGKDGGFFMIRNMDFVNTVYLTYNQTGAVAQTTKGMAIDPGATLVMPLDEAMNSDIYGYLLTAGSGTVECRVMLSSPERDLMDPTQSGPETMS